MHTGKGFWTPSTSNAVPPFYLLAIYSFLPLQHIKAKLSQHVIWVCKIRFFFFLVLEWKLNFWNKIRMHFVACFWSKLLSQARRTDFVVNVVFKARNDFFACWLKQNNTSQIKWNSSTNNCLFIVIKMKKFCTITCQKIKSKITFLIEQERHSDWWWSTATEKKSTFYCLKSAQWYFLLPLSGFKDYHPRWRRKVKCFYPYLCVFVC